MCEYGKPRRESEGERVAEGYVYLLYSKKTGLYKVGLSNDPARRIREIEAEIRGMGWDILKSIPTLDMRRLERAFHDAFAGARSGKMEWFQLSPEQVELFAAIAETVPAEAREALGPAPSREPETIDLASEWMGIIGELKRRRQRLTAAVYGEARVEGFDGQVLRLVYPEEQGFHVGMARERAHTEKLISVLRDKIGRDVEIEVDTQQVRSRDFISGQEDEPETIDLASEWVGLMGELKRRRQALTAAVYGEARVEGFDGQVLRLVYPEEQSFHVGMARERVHLEKLISVLRERIGREIEVEVGTVGVSSRDIIRDQEEVFRAARGLFSDEG